MDWTADLAKMLGNGARRVKDVKKAFAENAVGFKNILIKRGGPMMRPKLRRTPEEAKEFDISTERGRFLLQREAMLEDALEGE